MCFKAQYLKRPARKLLQGWIFLTSGEFFDRRQATIVKCHEYMAVKRPSASQEAHDKAHFFFVSTREPELRVLGLVENVKKEGEEGQPER